MRRGNGRQIVPELGCFRQLDASAYSLYNPSVSLLGVQRLLVNLSPRRASDVDIPILQPGKLRLDTN